MKEKKELILYVTKDQEVKIEVSLDGETVWLNRNQMAALFDRDVKTIGKHINNTINEAFRGLPTVAKFTTVQQEGSRKVSREAIPGTEVSQPPPLYYLERLSPDYPE